MLGVKCFKSWLPFSAFALLLWLFNTPVEGPVMLDSGDMPRGMLLFELS